MLNEILYPALAIGAIGLFFGLLLGVASIIFKVEKDERIDKITDALPGANCGGCGYAGCSGLAKAIVEDGARPAKCNLITQENAEKIGEILGEKQALPEKKTARLLCSGTTKECTTTYELEEKLSCREAVELAGGPKGCPYGCLGLGSCVAVCEFGALSIEGGIARVDESKCRGCGKCASTCPKKLIIVVPQKAKVWVGCSSKDKGAVLKNYCTQGCIGCKICEKKCPEGAIKVVDNVAKVDASKCVSCLICVEACPRGVIKAD